jgi:hypothetical protein
MVRGRRIAAVERSVPLLTWQRTSISAVDDVDRQDALDVLEDALHWQLPASRWRGVDEAVRAMAEALTRDDVAAFRRAESDLELARPVRAVSAEHPPQDPVPEPVRERINELIHTLGGAAAPPQPQSDGPAAAG